MSHSALYLQQNSNPNAYNEVMADPDVLRWVNTWKQAGPELEAIRREELRSTDTVQSLRMLASLFNQATRTHSPRQDSGLVEMQRVFATLRAK